MPTQLLRVLFQPWRLHASCKFEVLTVGMFASAGQIIATIQIIHSSASSRVRLGLLAVVVSLVRTQSPIPASYLAFWCLFPSSMLFCTRLLSSSEPATFPHSTASTMKALLCLLTYSLSTKTLQLASRWCTALSYLHTACKSPTPIPFSLRPSKLSFRPFALISLLLSSL